MTLTELQNEVYTLTNRPDLTSQTLLAVRRATLKLHNTDFYSKDLHETAVDFQFPAYIHDFEYRTVFPRWRAAKYFRLWDAAFETAGFFFDIVEPMNTLDEYGANRERIAYQAGELFHLRARQQFRHILIGYYVNPDISIPTYSSWIADLFPYAIVAEAASTIFKAIGKDDEATLMKVTVNEDVGILKQNFIQSVGY